MSLAHPARGGAQVTLQAWLCPGTPPAQDAQPAHRHRVLQLLLRLPEAGDEEATAGPPEQALQCGGLLGLHGACHEAARQGGAGWAGSPSPPCLSPRGSPQQGTFWTRGREVRALDGSELGLVLCGCQGRAQSCPSLT